MKVEKKVIARLSKCYSIAPLRDRGKDCILVAAEKTERCLLFDRKGKLLDTVWEEPGGAMSMVENGDWEVRTLVKLPHVHRFDIVKRNGTNYLIACTLKSGHKFKDDWSMPGKVYAAALPEDLSRFDGEHPLKMQVIRENMLKNHGYYRITENDTDTCLISADSGVFRFFPPADVNGEWGMEQLLNTPSSDAVLVDFDGDGEMELAVLSPFHGDKITIYKRMEKSFEKVYEYDKPADFTHAIYGGNLGGKQVLIAGHRKGERNLIVFWWDATKGYCRELIDKDCGPANVFHYVDGEKDILISANREMDEIAMYTLEW